MQLTTGQSDFEDAARAGVGISDGHASLEQANERADDVESESRAGLCTLQFIIAANE
jgi:hypothetical protein